MSHSLTVYTSHGPMRCVLGIESWIEVFSGAEDDSVARLGPLSASSFVDSEQVWSLMLELFLDWFSTNHVEAEIHGYTVARRQSSSLGDFWYRKKSS